MDMPSPKLTDARRAELLASIPSLTPGQLKARSKGLGGSDAKQIMAGNWRELWEEKTGRRQPENLDEVLPVRMGNWTEDFNAIWYELQTGIRVDRSKKTRETTHKHLIHPFMVCNADGLVKIDGHTRLWEAKHTNPFGGEDEIKQTSYAQLQHNMEVLNLEGCELSVFYGNLKWRAHTVERDANYIAELMARESEFWLYVEKDEPPPADGVEAVKVAFDDLKIKDMRRDNVWVDSEATWLKWRSAVQSANAAEATLKGMVPADIGFAFGPELVIVRDRAGKLSLRSPNKKDALRIEEFLQGEPK
jgi:hypothetical protein